MDWRAKVELYEQIRREYEFGAGSVIGVARKLGVHRRMVREAVRNAVPAQRKKTQRPAVKMAAAATLIDAIPAAAPVTCGRDGCHPVGVRRGVAYLDRARN